MLSLAKVTANRRNALSSTGPRTNAGLAASSKNALRHGLSAGSFVVLEGVENPADFEVLRDAIVDDLDAHGTVEVLLAERVAQLFWRLHRVVRYETEHLSQLLWDKLPSIADFETALKEREQRKVVGRALGHLFRPEHEELDGQNVRMILSAFLRPLDGEQRAAFCGPGDDPLAAIAVSEKPCIRATYTVGDVLTFLRAAEGRLEELGRVMPPQTVGGAGARTNFIADMYEYYLGVNCVWDTTDGSVASGIDRERTNAMLLELARAGIIDRYEPRLRRDLSHSLRDLADLQSKRRDVSCR